MMPAVKIRGRKESKNRHFCNEVVFTAAKHGSLSFFETEHRKPRLVCVFRPARRHRCDGLNWYFFSVGVDAMDDHIRPLGLH